MGFWSRFQGRGVASFFLLSALRVECVFESAAAVACSVKIARPRCRPPSISESFGGSIDPIGLVGDS